MKLFRVNTDGKFIRYAERDFKEGNQEDVLEFWLENNPAYILEDENVLIIGRQVPTNLGSIIDLLGIDREGNVVVIELKRDRTPRETIAQILEYASFVERLSYSQLEHIFRDYCGEENPGLIDYHRNYFQLEGDEAVAFNRNQKLIIVGQVITKEIMQTSAFLRKKGIEVFCLEFKYFETKAGERIISSDFVIGKDMSLTKKVSSGALPRIDKAEFVNSLDHFGRAFFEDLLVFAETNGLPIHWGTRGFSINVDLNGKHVAILYGFPPQSVFKQTLYTAFKEIRNNVNDSEPIIEQYRQELVQLGAFENAQSEQKWLIKNDIDADKKERFFAILSSIVEKIKLQLKEVDEEGK
jgi:hypothetical protein